MSLVDDEDLVAVTRWGEGSAFAELAGVVNATVRGRVDFDDVEGTGPTCGEVAARRAFAARMRGRALLAVQATSEDAGRRCFTAAAGSGEQVRVVDTVFIQSHLEWFGHVILPDDVFKRVGSEPAV